MKEPLVITISRQYGSGGHKIGALAAKKMGIAFYDKEIIGIAALKSGIDEYFFLEAENKEVGSLLYNLAAGLVQRCVINSGYSTRYLRQVHACKASRSAHYAVALQTHT